MLIPTFIKKIRYGFLPGILSLLVACTSNQQQYQTENPPETTSLLKEDFDYFSEKNIWTVEALSPEEGIDTINTFINSVVPISTPYTLKSPTFDIDPLTYHRLNFRAKASHKSLWALVFFDKLGDMLLADIYSSFDSTASWEDFTFYFQSKYDAVQAQFWIRPMGDTVTIELDKVEIVQEENPEYLKRWADSIYAEMPPLSTIDLPEYSHDMLPQTMETLNNGGNLRIVMLGNSIINDTGNSGWEIQVEAMYPGADIEVITSVRGGTGCWYYQENNRVDSFVLRYQPDLLIIGGISHREDTAAIHNVIRQVRAQSDTEILVCSGPVGREGDPRSNPEFTLTPQPGSFRMQLEEMAHNAQVAYYDIKTQWGKYIQSSEKPYDYFLRDPVHANARGRQVLARLMVQYFDTKDTQ